MVCFRLFSNRYTIDVGVPLPSLLPCAHFSTLDFSISCPIRMPATQATCTLIDDELLSIMHKLIFKTAPTMAFRRGQNYTATLQVGTILVTMAPKILELVT